MATRDDERRSISAEIPGASASARSSRGGFAVVRPTEASRPSANEKGESGKGAVESPLRYGVDVADDAESADADLPANASDALEGEPSEGGEQPSGRKIPWRAIGLTAAAIVAVLLALFVFFAVNRWALHDDHADLQGTWYVVGTDVAVSVTSDVIHLKDGVDYTYEIDDTEKTIRYTFGPMEGSGHYWFDDRREHVVIADGQDYTAAGTTVDDLLHAFVDFSKASAGEPLSLPEGEGIIALSRTPEIPVTLTPEQAAANAESQAASSNSGQSEQDSTTGSDAAVPAAENAHAQREKDEAFATVTDIPRAEPSQAEEGSEQEGGTPATTE